MVRLGVVGAGKMGISHCAISRMHPSVEFVGIADTSRLLLSLLERNSAMPTFSSVEALFEDGRPDAVIVATPSRLHTEIVEAALSRGIDVFCEKPLTLDPAASARLEALARSNDRVTQVGYHYRFVSTFCEVSRLLGAGAIGPITHALAEAYGPVVLRRSGRTWRGRADEGGGCLYDYAAHAINLLTWYFGAVESVAGASLRSVFSASVDDAVHASMRFASDVTAQLSANWSDESQRKMSTRITIWGEAGRIQADRQEIRAYFRDPSGVPPGYVAGWNVRYTTDLSSPVAFYLRGEEYSLQIDEFVRRIENRETSGTNDFAGAVDTDRAIALVRAAATGHGVASDTSEQPSAAPPRKRRVPRIWTSSY